LCVAIFVDDTAQAKGHVATAAEVGADMVELRLDRRDDADDVHEAIQQSALSLEPILPFIATCRPTWEGGESTLDDAQRIEFLKYVSGATGAPYVDLELETYRRNPNTQWPAGLILSAHDFKGRPDRLYNLLSEM